MIISHKHKFIFLKTNKTAGTSVEIALSKYCGEDDIITPISPEDEAIRVGLGYRSAQNYKIPFSQYTLKDWGKLILKGEKQEFYNHISAERVKRFIDKDVWDSYFKFCIVRNPWDRVISKYYWHYKTEPRPTILEFLQTWAVENMKRRGLGIYTIDGEVVVDRICRFENLANELEDICSNNLGIQDKITLPRTKTGTRKDKRHYRDILTDAEKNKMAKIFEKEISLLGYEF